ncbi:uncharacterized protein [Dermacentor albipictus]|uniref:uncharacterized protein n=1 Tax=Dermacentor albipictus TaxID=60249 RepID=UPI0031FBD25E
MTLRYRNMILPRRLKLSARALRLKVPRNVHPPPKCLPRGEQGPERLRAQVLLGSAAVSTTSHAHYVDHRISIDRSGHVQTNGHFAPSTSDGPELLATPFGQRSVTSSTAACIKEPLCCLNFSGHGGPGTATMLTRHLLFVMQW